MNIIPLHIPGKMPLAVMVVSATFLGMAVPSQGAVPVPLIQSDTTANMQQQIIQIRATQTASQRRALAKARKLIRRMKANNRKMQQLTRSVRTENARLKRYNAKMKRYNARYGRSRRYR